MMLPIDGAPSTLAGIGRNASEQELGQVKRQKTKSDGIVIEIDNKKLSEQPKSRGKMGV